MKEKIITAVWTDLIAICIGQGTLVIAEVVLVLYELASSIICKLQAKLPMCNISPVRISRLVIWGGIFCLHGDPFRKRESEFMVWFCSILSNFLNLLLIKWLTHTVSVSFHVQCYLVVLISHCFMLLLFNKCLQRRRRAHSHFQL